MEDPEDLGLKAVMGDRFRDVRMTGGSPGSGGTKPPGIPALAWALALGLFGYWFRMGHMDAAAAVPCMVVCGGLAGFRLGSGRGQISQQKGG